MSAKNEPSFIAHIKVKETKRLIVWYHSQSWVRGTETGSSQIEWLDESIM